MENRDKDRQDRLIKAIGEAADNLIDHSTAKPFAMKINDDWVAMPGEAWDEIVKEAGL